VSPFQKGHKINVGGKGWPGPHPPHCGFQKGHPPYHSGFPGHSGGNRKRGKNRAPQCGFQKGHPNYYSGSVIGHLPTNGTVAARMKPIPRSKERELMEAIQNGKDPLELAKRYPPGMVKRLEYLQKVAIDVEHRDFIKAQIMVREILTRGRGEGEDPSASTGHTVTLLHGSAVAPPLPGSAPEPGAAPAAPGETGGNSAAPTGAEKGWSTPN